MNPLNQIRRLFTPEIVHAHCDIPCGIYNPVPAQIAAQTVHKMVTKILELKQPEHEGSADQVFGFSNSISRMVAVKEEHAQLCKKELLILWTDYFKPDHLKMFPDLHEKFWKAAKLCSKNKQEINLEAAKQLQDAVKDISATFDKAEAAKKK